MIGSGDKLCILYRNRVSFFFFFLKSIHRFDLMSCWLALPSLVGVTQTLLESVTARTKRDHCRVCLDTCTLTKLSLVITNPKR